MKKDKLKSIPTFLAAKPLYIDKKDSRFKKNYKQIKDRGFSDTELWNLNYAIACFIYPRLKEFRKNAEHNGHPIDLTPKKWVKVLDDILFFFEAEITQCVSLADSDLERVAKGRQLFCDRFNNLWT